MRSQALTRSLLFDAFGNYPARRLAVAVERHTCRMRHSSVVRGVSRGFQMVEAPQQVDALQFDLDG